MIAFALYSLFLIFLSEPEKVFLDPLFILEAHTKQEYNRVMIVELKEAEINLYRNLSPLSILNSSWKPNFIPIVYTKELKLDEINCILKNMQNVKKCFSGNIIYVRSPRKLFPKNIIKENYNNNSISVDEIIGEGRIFTKIYESSEEIGARVARDVFRVSGKGVVVGIIDTGVRWYSKLLAYDVSDALSPLGLKKNFSKAAIIWDQENQNYSGGFTTPNNFNYGIECLFPSLREGLKDHKGCPTQDTLGHGTHISGVISLDVGDGKEVGIAPESLLVVVSTPMYEDLVVDAVKYIFSYAEKWNLPAVINISLGGHFGPHDGTSLFEILLRQQIGKGRIIVSAGGNEANQKIHVGGEFQGEASAVVDLIGDCEVQFWVSKDSNLEISAHILGIKDSYTEIKKGERKFVVNSGTQVALIDYEGGADISFYLENITYSKSHLKDGIIFASRKISDKLVLSFRSSKKVRIDGWISSDPQGCIFSSEYGDIKPTSEGTIAVPGTSPDIIAVGSYNLTSQRSQKGDISVFSSWGFDSTKPNITAPGEVIFSLCPSQDEYLCGDSGTSQATPHVTGAVALALERNPYLTPSDIIDALCKGALKDKFTGEVPNKIWGCGKLRVPEFLSNIPPVLRTDKKEKNNIESRIFSERIGNKTYNVIYMKSSFPFRILNSSGYYDLGWSTYHKLYFDSNIPNEFEIEFLDGERRKVYTSGLGLDTKSCGCLISSQNNLYSFFAFIIYITLFFAIFYMRKKCN